MSTVTEIIEAVKILGVEDKRQFLARLSEVDFDEAWDLQIAADGPSRPARSSLAAGIGRHQSRKDKAAR
jgi:hypothetical protein